MEVDISILLIPIAILAGVVIGRYSAKRPSIQDFNESLSYLTKQHSIIVRRQLDFSLILGRSQMCTRSMVVCYLLILVLLKAHNEMYLLYDYPIVSIVYISITVLAYASHYLSRWIVNDCETQMKIISEKIINSRKDLIASLGQDVLEAVRADKVCNKRCEEAKEALKRDVQRHQWLIQELGRFNWCDACCTQRQCHSGCGGRFWNHTKNSLENFRQKIVSQENKK